MVTSASIFFPYYKFRARYLGISSFQFYFLLIFGYEMTPFRGIIKFTIELVPIPAGSWQDVNVGTSQTSQTKSDSNISLIILFLKIFGRYLPQEWLVFQFFVKHALIDPHAKFQICRTSRSRFCKYMDKNWIHLIPKICCAKLSLFCIIQKRMELLNEVTIIIDFWEL